jgi:peptide/nickel transport system substrate-binding protein
LSEGGISRRTVLAASAAGLGLAGAALVGFGRRDGSQRTSPRKGGFIRIATQSSSTADTLDPAKGGTATDYVRHFMLYNGLTKNSPDLSAQLSLAEAIDSDDLVTWSIKLRPGVRFHDGSELTSADVVWSLQRHKDPLIASKVATIAEQFADIRADGRRGVLLRLTNANADLPAILAQSQFLIVRNGEDKPAGNGTGPFRLAQFKPGVRTVVVRNPEYWVPDRPRLERIELISIPDDVGRVNALLSGDVQLINAIDARASRRVAESPGHGLMTTRSGLFTNLIMRQDALPTGNPHFVAAIQHLIDRDLVNRALFRNTATVANDHPIPPFHPYFNPDIPQRTQDLDKARWHVARAGLSGVPLPMFASPAANGSVDMASILQEFGSRVGLNLAVNRVPADGYWSTHWMRHPLTFGNTNPRPTADLVFSLFFKSDADWNETGWKNPRFDQLLLEARGARDESLRRELYGEMQRIVHERCPMMIPVFIGMLDGHDIRLKGWEPVPLGGMGGYRFAEDAWWDE